MGIGSSELLRQGVSFAASLVHRAHAKASARSKPRAAHGHQNGGWTDRRRGREQVLLDNPQYQTSFLGIDPHIKYRLTTQTNLSRYCTTSRTAITRESGCAIFTVYRRMRCAPRCTSGALHEILPPTQCTAPDCRMQLLHPSMALWTARHRRQLAY